MSQLSVENWNVRYTIKLNFVTEVTEAVRQVATRGSCYSQSLMHFFISICRFYFYENTIRDYLKFNFFLILTVTLHILKAHSFNWPNPKLWMTSWAWFNIRQACLFHIFDLFRKVGVKWPCGLARRSQPQSKKLLDPIANTLRICVNLYLCESGQWSRHRQNYELITQWMSVGK